MQPSKRPQVLYALSAIFLVVIIVLASTAIYFYLQNKDVREDLNQKRLQELESRAYNIWSALERFMSKFHSQTERMNRSLRTYTYNETKVLAILSACQYLSDYAYDTYRSVETDLTRLESLDEEHLLIYVNVSETVEAALGQVEWATRGKTNEGILNETPRFLWELYDLLGISQIFEIENLSRMKGIARSFSRLSDCWGHPTWAPPLQTVMNWLQANTTAFYQTLTQWEEYRNPIFSYH